MTVFRCNRRKSIWIWVWLLLVTVWVSGIGYGQTAAAPGKENKEAERIHITADNLVADDNEKFAEFSGNVKAVQGGTEITADRLRILYQGSPAAGESAESNSSADPQGSIQRIIAVGAVRITFDEMVAEAREAVYTTADRILVLSGPDSKVIKPDSGTISGSRITVERDTGRIRFEGNVEGIFVPGEKGLN